MTTYSGPAVAVASEIGGLIRALIEVGLADDQNFPSARSRPGGFMAVESEYWSLGSPGFHKSGTTYSEFYKVALDQRAYDIRMLDGGLIQMRYEFKGKNLNRSSMGFYPPPDLTPFQEDPELYLNDEIYGHIVDARVVTVPVRFDFDCRTAVVKELLHPAAHATFGQYPHCRIPMTSASTPHQFVELILRSFYRTKTELWTDRLTATVSGFPSSIQGRESDLIHIAVP